MVGETGIVIEKQPAYVDPALIWRKGMGVIPKAEDRAVSAIVAAGKKPLIIDIETTGAEPWADRIICIGVKDPFLPTSEPIVFINDNEEKVVLDFLDYFIRGEYNQLIGYNTAFDFRFIFSKMLYYRIASSEFCTVDLYDIMQVMEQVKQAFVYGYNKSGKLGDWTQNLFGLQKPMDYHELLDAWEKHDFARIVNYNKFDVENEFIIYALIELVKEQPYTGVSFAIPSGSVPQTTGNNLTTTSPTSSKQITQTWNAACPNCFSVFEVPISKTEYVCPIDGTIIKQGG